MSGEEMAATAGLSIVVPTFRERANIGPLIEAFEGVFGPDPAAVELLVVDDNSQDGIDEVVREMARPWVRLIVRTDLPPDLSLSVLRGFDEARFDTLVVMDCDLSHPPDRIPDLVGALGEAEFVLGSRFIDGGSTSHEWGPLRWLNSQVAILLTRTLIDLKDPMSGFFALKRATFDRAKGLDPTGYKIGLELIVRCHCEPVREIPIHFENRVRGKSKLTLVQQLRFVQHLLRLHRYRTFGR